METLTDKNKPFNQSHNERKMSSFRPRRQRRTLYRLLFKKISQLCKCKSMGTTAAACRLIWLVWDAGGIGANERTRPPNGLDGWMDEQCNDVIALWGFQQTHLATIRCSINRNFIQCNWIDYFNNANRVRGGEVGGKINCYAAIVLEWRKYRSHRPIFLESMFYCALEIIILMIWGRRNRFHINEWGLPAEYVTYIV